MNRIRTTGRTLAALGIMLCAAAPASQAATAGDGCEALAALVGAQVDAAIGRELFGQTARPPGIAAHATGALGCGRTAETVSRAFAERFAVYGEKVNWADLPDPGDVCLSHYIDQCYPGGGGSPLFANGFVGGTWNSVRAAVGESMPFGRLSDLSWFRPPDLANELAGQLGLAPPEPASARQDYLELR